MPEINPKIEVQINGYDTVNIVRYRPNKSKPGEYIKVSSDSKKFKNLDNILSTRGDGIATEIVVMFSQELEETYNEYQKNTGSLKAFKNSKQFMGTHNFFNSTFSIQGDSYDTISFQGLLNETRQIGNAQKSLEENRFLTTKHYDIDNDYKTSDTDSYAISHADIIFEQEIDDHSTTIAPGDHKQLESILESFEATIIQQQKQLEKRNK